MVKGIGSGLTPAAAAARRRVNAAFRGAGSSSGTPTSGARQTPEQQRVRREKVKELSDKGLVFHFVLDFTAFFVAGLASYMQKVSDFTPLALLTVVPADLKKRFKTWVYKLSGDKRRGEVLFRLEETSLVLYDLCSALPSCDAFLLMVITTLLLTRARPLRAFWTNWQSVVGGSFSWNTCTQSRMEKILDEEVVLGGAYAQYRHSTLGLVVLLS